MSKFNFVIVSKNDEFKLKKETANKFESDIEFNVITNNTESLAAVYNKFILKHRQQHDIDFLVLMHADVSFNIDSFCEHIEQVKNKYDVIGLCGCAKFSISQTPLNWFTGSNPYPETRWGCVTHGEMNNQTSFFSQHSPTILDHEVACIDGLCIVLSKQVLENTNMLFDQTFQYSHYDTDISLQTVIKYKLKLGVIVQKDLVHYSVGKSILSEDFRQKEKDFREKWKF